MNNLLIHSENLKALNYLVNDMNLKGKIDLVYIDPPFATGIKFLMTNGRAQTISKSSNGNVAYNDTLTGKDYMNFLRERLTIIHQLLSENGSLYLHIDYKIGHYVKILLDEIFGIDNFKNDISRVKCNPKNFDRIGYGNIKDMILFYSKTSKPIWNEPREKYSNDDLIKLFPKTDKNGRRFTTVPIHAPGETVSGNSSMAFKGMLPPEGRHWRTDVEQLEKWDKEGLIEWSSNGNPRKIIYADERTGKRIQDIWEFKDPQYPKYPTEKNSDMLDIIIKTSSNPNSIVLDCFCGSGTTLKAAHLNNRYWIGIDESKLAIETTINKISSIQNNIFSQSSNYEFLDLTT